MFGPWGALASRPVPRGLFASTRFEWRCLLLPRQARRGQGVEVCFWKFFLNLLFRLCERGLAFRMRSGIPGLEGVTKITE